MHLQHPAPLPLHGGVGGTSFSIMLNIFPRNAPAARSLLSKPLITSALRQSPTSTRSFHASTANMVIKCYFDCSWTGPKAQVDQSGNITSLDKSEQGRPSPTSSS